MEIRRHAVDSHWKTLNQPLSHAVRVIFGSVSELSSASAVTALSRKKRGHMIGMCLRHEGIPLSMANDNRQDDPLNLFSEC